MDAGPSAFGLCSDPGVALHCLARVTAGGFTAIHCCGCQRHLTLGLIPSRFLDSRPPTGLDPPGGDSDRFFPAYPDGFGGRVRLSAQCLRTQVGQLGARSLRAAVRRSGRGFPL